MRISDWSSDVCSSDLHDIGVTVICPGSVRTRILGASRNRPTELQATNVSPPTEFTDPTGALDPDELGVGVRAAVIANAPSIVPLPKGIRVLFRMVKPRFAPTMTPSPYALKVLGGNLKFNTHPTAFERDTERDGWGKRGGGR